MAFEPEQNNTLSLCMIVKNEEVNLERCLMSVSGVIDEIIIVDTGSSDKTKEVAERYGAKIYDYEWNNNFSEARNLSLEKASCDWILVLDADEEIATDSREKLKEAIQFENGIANFVYIIENFGNSPLQSLQPRIFRNHKSITYDMPVAENIFESLVDIELKEKKLTRHFEILISHFCFEDQNAALERFSRNTQLLEQELSDPSISHEKRVHFLIKLIYNYRFLTADPNKIISLISHTFELMSNQKYKENKYDPKILILHTYIIDYLLQIRKIDSAKETLDNILKVYTNSLNLNFFDLNINLEMGRRDEAARSLMRCKYLLESSENFKFESIMLQSVAISVATHLKSFHDQGVNLQELEADVIQELKKKSSNRPQKVK